MEKKIENYLPLYLPNKLKCQRQGEDGIFEITGISYDDTQKIWWVYFENEESGHSVIEDVLPLLRKLSSLTEEESREICMILTNYEICYNNSLWLKNRLSKQLPPELFLYLLSKNFDLFQLLESGLAIEQTKN